MKKLLILSAALLLLNTGSYAGKCSGGRGCTACKNCSACKHCSKQGGTCSVCHNYDAKPKKKKK